jgi:hypothetical protein
LIFGLIFGLIFPIFTGLTQHCSSKARCRRQYACTARQRNAAGAILRKSYFIKTSDQNPV